MAAFIDQLVDWRKFEKFVGRLFSDDPNVVVEHDVTEAGKSGASRQIDVKLTHKVGDITYVTIIECKRWKDKVDRQRIDVLAATLEDLRASKGVLFTTSGFEEGAEVYARDRGIELFVVRDLRDEEWGLPGRLVSFWWQLYAAEFGHFSFETPQLLAIVDRPPTSVNVEVTIDKETAHDEGLRLHSVVDGESGPNLTSLFLDARMRALDLLAREGKIFEGRRDEDEKYLLMPIRLDLSAFETRQLVRNYGAVRLSAIDFELVIHASQKRQA